MNKREVRAGLVNFQSHRGVTLWLLFAPRKEKKKTVKVSDKNVEGIIKNNALAGLLRYMSFLHLHSYFLAHLCPPRLYIYTHIYYIRVFLLSPVQYTTKANFQYKFDLTRTLRLLALALSLFGLPTHTKKCIVVCIFLEVHTSPLYGESKYSALLRRAA